MTRTKILRLLCLALAACLLLGSAVPAYADSVTEEEALELVFADIFDKFAAVDEPPWDKQAVPGFDDEEVIQYFVEVALWGEYDGYRGYVMRYEKPVTYYVMGDPMEADIAQLADLAEALNKIPGYPGITRTYEETEATIRIMFSDEATYENYFRVNVPNGSWGYATVNYYTDGEEKGKIGFGRVWISNEAWPRLDRNSVICEEFIQSRGMLNDPSYGYYSIFDQNSNDCDWPSELDWAVVKLLYDPRIDRFASEEEIRSTAQEILNSWK